MLLHRYTGHEDIMVGSPMAGRTQAAFEGVVGYFVNPLPLRANLTGEPPFAVFLQQVRRFGCSMRLRTRIILFRCWSSRDFSLVVLEIACRFFRCCLFFKPQEKWPDRSADPG